MEQKEPKYLNLSANCTINLSELFHQTSGNPPANKAIEAKETNTQENKETETDKK